MVYQQNAVTRLYRYVRDSRGELMPGGEQSERKRIELCGKVVSKAYIEPGFGQSIITRMDAMLREVRCL